MLSGRICLGLPREVGRMTTHLVSGSSPAAAFTPEEIAMKRYREEWDNEGGAVRMRSDGSSPSTSQAQEAVARKSRRDEHRT
jgi:hypothetical protein